MLLGYDGLAAAAVLVVFGVPGLTGIALIKGAPCVVHLAAYPAGALWVGRIAGAALLALGLLLELLVLVVFLGPATA